MYQNKYGRKIPYGVKQYQVDNVADINSIPLLTTTQPGSTVFVVNTSERYILTKQYKWQKIASGKKESNTMIYDGGDIEKLDFDYEIIYDGTEI